MGHSPEGRQRPAPDRINVMLGSGEPLAIAGGHRHNIPALSSA